MKDRSANDDALKKMLKESGLDSPSKDFTASLMKMIAPETQPAISAQPVFSRMQVISFITLIGAAIMYALLSGSTYSLPYSFSLNPVSENFSIAIQRISSPILLVVLISGWILYIFDRLLKKRILHS